MVRTPIRLRCARTTIHVAGALVLLAYAVVLAGIGSLLTIAAT